MVTRDEIVSNDLGTFNIGAQSITFSFTQANNFFAKLCGVIDRFFGTNIPHYADFSSTIKFIVLNYFKYYADCDMHYTFSKDEITNNLFYRDVENLLLNVFIPNEVKYANLFAYFDLSPAEKIERDYSREEHSMTENAPINTAIDALTNPSGKSKGDGTINEDISTTNLYNRAMAIQQLAGNLTLKRIVEETLKKYVYELNKIY